MRRYWLSLVLVLLASWSPASGLALTGRVVDEAGVLPAPVEARLATKLEAYENRTHHQFVVVTVKSLGGKSIDAFGLALGKRWGIGRKHFDDGLLLIVAPNERMVRIEVGKGLETRLTNARAAAIIRNNLLPAFRAGNLLRGIKAGGDAVMAALPD